jgi:small GTP-binding protein
LLCAFGSKVGDKKLSTLIGDLKAIHTKQGTLLRRKKVTSASVSASAGKFLSKVVDFSALDHTPIPTYQYSTTIHSASSDYCIIVLMDEQENVCTDFDGDQKDENDVVNEYACKVLVVGDAKVGKTSILRRYTHGVFSQHVKTTIGVDFGLKVIQREPNSIVRLQLWDISGQERFIQMTHVYYRNATAAIVVFDLNAQETFENVKKWKADIDLKVKLPNEKPIPVLLFANKVDLLEDGISKERREELDQYCQENGFIGWYSTSAKDNIGINDAFNFLVDHILKNVQQLPKQIRKQNLTLKNDETKKEQSTCSC